MHIHNTVCLLCVTKIIYYYDTYMHVHECRFSVPLLGQAWQMLQRITYFIHAKCTIIYIVDQATVC